jgi:ABC-type lipoprotein export system ATPase subunit
MSATKTMIESSEIMIEAAAVERTFASGDRRVKALRGVDLAVPRGAFVVLMGPSGSGKTTLLNLVGGLDQPTGGYVAVGGQRLDELGGQDLAELRRGIGFIFQSFALMPTASAYENVELGLRLSGRTPRREWDTRVRRCLGAVGLTSWMHHRPYEMSGGQQQRVAIARAIAIRPQIILADEPTGDLDSKTGRQVLGLLRSLCDHEGATLLMATHDPAAAEFATELVRLRDGMVESRERFAEAAQPVL